MASQKVLNGWDILSALRARGLNVRLEGGRIMVGPSQLIDDADRAILREHRALVVAALKWEQHPTIATAIEKLDGRIVSIKEVT